MLTEGNSEKVNKTNLKNIIMKIFNSFKLSTVFKNIFYLFIKIKVFVVN
jgi:hypothetical protein